MVLIFLGAARGHEARARHGPSEAYKRDQNKIYDNIGFGGIKRPF